MNKARYLKIAAAAIVISLVITLSRGTGVENRGGIIAALFALNWIPALWLSSDRRFRALFIVYLLLIAPYLLLLCVAYSDSISEIIWEGSDIVLACISGFLGYWLLAPKLQWKTLLLRGIFISTFLVSFNRFFLWPNYDSWLATLDVKVKTPLALSDLQLQGEDLKPLNLDAYRGKVVFVDVWNEGCGACLRALPEIDAIRRKFRSDTGIKVVSLYSNYSKRSNSNYGKHGKLFRRFNETLPLWFDTSNQVGKHIQFIGYPMHLIFGRDGKLKEAGHYNLEPLVLYKNPRMLIRKVSNL
jgi:thiol-disulfide isomerase/thioredoxin